MKKILFGGLSLVITCLVLVGCFMAYSHVIETNIMMGEGTQPLFTSSEDDIPDVFSASEDDIPDVFSASEDDIPDVFSL